MLQTIYDVTGNVIRQCSWAIYQLAVTAKQRMQFIYWDGKVETGELVSSGTYFYQIDAGDYTETRKMVILK